MAQITVLSDNCADHVFLILVINISASSSLELHQNNRIATYEKMWKFMNATPELSFVKNLTEAVERVKTGEYAYISESTTVEYVIHRLVLQTVSYKEDILLRRLFTCILI